MLHLYLFIFIACIVAIFVRHDLYIYSCHYSWVNEMKWNYKRDGQITHNMYKIKYNTEFW